MQSVNRQRIGMFAAMMTPVLMGLAPIFGKLSITAGFDAFTLAAIRTCSAALILWIFYGLFARKYIFIFPAGLIGTITVGGINGLGSLLYYNGLLVLDNASLTQLLNMTYVIFVMMITRLYGRPISGMSIIRVILSFVAIYILTTPSGERGQIHWVGIVLVLGSAATYGLHVVMSQRVMFEMPAPTMALYALTFMGLTVLIARLGVGILNPAQVTVSSQIQSDGWQALFGLTLITALSRIALFTGVRNLGSVQTSLMNIGEVGVTLIVAFFLFPSEGMSLLQWGGVLILFSSILLSRFDNDKQDAVYRPLPNTELMKQIFNRDPIMPTPFSTVSRLYRRPPTPQLPDHKDKIPY